MWVRLRHSSSSSSNNILSLPFSATHCYTIEKKIDWTSNRSCLISLIPCVCVCLSLSSCALRIRQLFELTATAADVWYAHAHARSWSYHDRFSILVILSFVQNGRWREGIIVCMSRKYFWLHRRRCQWFFEPLDFYSFNLLGKVRAKSCQHINN